MCKFCEHIILEAKRLYNSFLELPMIPPTNKQKELHETAKKFCICTNKVIEKDFKVRDHCHYAKQYRGPGHMSCNFKYKIPSYIPVVFHNLAGYDAHLFIKKLASYTNDIGVIAKTTENYISFSIKVKVDK